MRQINWRSTALLLQSSAVAAGLSVPAMRVAAQVRSNLDLGGVMIEVGGEEENYLRALQVAGLAPLTPWSIQPFSPSQVALLRNGAKDHPWSTRYDTTRANERDYVLRPRARLVGNSSFPFQTAPGPTWSGRGITGEVQDGVTGSWGPVYLEVAPLAFLAQNASFPLAPNGETGTLSFADARYPLNIDLPQRFGSSAYGRLDPGTSQLALDSRFVVGGVSTAPQQWGPAREYPLVLGPNAGGFPEAFVGTSQPLDLWLFRAHGRLLYGELGQSDYTEPVDGETRRLASGLVLDLVPRWLPGLEVGASRFIHRPWEGFPTASALARPFSGIFGSGANAGVNLRNENQNASFFARWAVPAVKAEIYAEMYKEDYWGTFHGGPDNLVESPDDYSAFTVGFQRVFTSNRQSVRVLRGELVNGETSHQQRGERGFTVPLPIYIHSAETQGHTLDGLLLGSPDAYGGAGWQLGVDDYSTVGRRSFTLERSLRFDWLPTLPANSGLVHPDVIYDVRADFLRFRGKHDYGIIVIPAIDLNRNLVAHHDVFNLAVDVTWR